MSTWGSALKQFREMAGLSQYQLAGLAQIGRDKVSRFECGYTEPSTEEQQKLEAVISEALAERRARLAKLRSRERARKTAVQQEITI